MFSTLRFDPHGAEPIRVERQRYAHEINQGPGPQHSACENCRLKKLRCSGTRPSCHRCQETSIKCIFETPPKSKNATLFDPTKSKSTSQHKVRAAESGLHLQSTVAGDEPDGLEEDRDSSNQPSFLANLNDWTAEGMEFETMDNFSEETEISPNSPLGETYRRPGESSIEDFMQYLVDSPPLDQDIGMNLNPAEEHTATVQHRFPRTTINRRNGRSDSLLSQNRSQRNNSSPAIFCPNQRSQIPPTYTHNGMLPVAMCHCWSDMVNILEMLGQEGYGSDDQGIQPPIDSILSFQRSAVEKCTSMLDCTFCFSSSERILVLVLVGDKLISKFEEVLKRQQFLPNSRPDAFDAGLTRPATATTASSNRPGNGGVKLFLGDYEIHTSEWMSLLDTLLNLQVRRLGNFISRLKVWATSAHGIAHLAMLSKLERRFQGLMTVYQPADRLQ
ncbi:hypothetical protein BGW36DRAFT_423037 [Talaromyces proteolyticus]|uniref:Zn(2)-C6 fungal-type domain-containing protein n=1 Tax=Talaromyces proteolyticus TaxID=1131652 RepID=A0AAD4Q4X9_9EURO|nr:uncharacterized protein BGW36DRAFT_423037 [Talaromyces proteolyticus]KAH8703475.1 hypothetical protein BGW36DRAFT_423037 [Talaromyces proteolyticus]